MSRIRQIFKRTRSEDGISSPDDTPIQSDTASDKTPSKELDKADRQRTKLHRRSKSDNTLALLLSQSESKITREPQQSIDTVSIAMPETLSPTSKDEEEARSIAAFTLVEQIGNQIAGRRTSSQAKTATHPTSNVPAKIRTATPRPSSVNSGPSASSEAVSLKAPRSPGFDNTTAPQTTSLQLDHSKSLSLPYRPRVILDATEDPPIACRLVSDRPKSQSNGTAHLPSEHSLIVSTSSSSPRTITSSSPDRPSPHATRPSPASSVSSSPGSATSPKHSKPRNGPSTCTYDSSTKTSLGIEYETWLRWRCCTCRHETHWEGPVCSKLDCSHAKCEHCRTLAK